MRGKVNSISCDWLTLKVRSCKIRFYCFLKVIGSWDALRKDASGSPQRSSFRKLQYICNKANIRASVWQLWEKPQQWVLVRCKVFFHSYSRWGGGGKTFSQQARRDVAKHLQWSVKSQSLETSIPRIYPRGYRIYSIPFIRLSYIYAASQNACVIYRCVAEALLYHPASLFQDDISRKFRIYTYIYIYEYVWMYVCMYESMCYLARLSG